MRGGRLVARAFAILLSVTFGWTVTASCVEAATSTPAAQMACCKRGHHTCGMRGTPADCCKTQSAPTKQGQFTAVDKFSAHEPHLAAVPVFDLLVSLSAFTWAPALTTHALAPPGSKHPTYLVLSTFRI